MNRVTLTGRTTKDIETRTVGEKGTLTCRFTLAVRRDKDNSDFVSCQAWGKTAELMQKYVPKGSLIGIVGKIRTGSYDKNGQKVYTTDVVVDELEFLEKKAEGQKAEAATPDGFVPVPDDLTDDDLPF